MSYASLIGGVEKGVRGLRALETEDVQEQRREHVQRLRVSKREIDDAMDKPRSFGYGTSGWKPRCALSGEMRREILRLFLHAGTAAPANLESRTEPLTEAETRKILRAFLVAEKVEKMGRDDVVRDPLLWDISIWDRRTVHAGELAEENDPVSAYQPSASVAQDDLRPDIGREMRANQHLRRWFRDFEEEGLVVIANVPYVPDLPPPPSTKRLRVDGRYGYHDPTRYVQIHVPGFWHMAFCPGFAASHSNLADDIAWYDLDVANHCRLERDGTYTPIDELKQAIKRACERQMDIFNGNKTYALGAPHRAAMDMRSTAVHICNHIFSVATLRTSIAGFQENLLELRAWDNYKTALSYHRRLVRKLSLDAEEWLRPAPQGNIRREFRGAYVTSLDAANVFGHLQAPVFWIRARSPKVVAFLNQHKFTEIRGGPYVQRPETAIMPGEVGAAATCGALYATRPAHSADADSSDDGMSEDYWGEYNDASEPERAPSKRQKAKQKEMAAKLAKFTKAKRGTSSRGSSSRAGAAASGTQPLPEMWEPTEYRRMHEGRDPSAPSGSSSGSAPKPSRSTASTSQAGPFSKRAQSSSLASATLRPVRMDDADMSQHESMILKHGASTSSPQAKAIDLPATVDPALRKGLQLLRDLVAHLPGTTPIGMKSDIFYQLAVDPSSLQSEEGPLHAINKQLDRVFQQGSHSLTCSELAATVRRGPVGIVCACNFLEGAARILGAESGLLLARVDRLVDALKTMIPDAAQIVAISAASNREDDERMDIDDEGPLYVNEDVPMEDVQTAEPRISPIVSPVHPPVQAPVPPTPNSLVVPQVVPPVPPKPNSLVVPQVVPPVPPVPPTPNSLVVPPVRVLVHPPVPPTPTPNSPVDAPVPPTPTPNSLVVPPVDALVPSTPSSPVVPPSPVPPVPPAPASSKSKKRKREDEGEFVVDYYYVKRPDYVFPSWFPNETSWPSALFEVDDSKERMKRLAGERVAPVRYTKQGYLYRTPRAELFANDKKAEMMMAVWLVIRPFVLLAMVLLSIMHLPGLSRDEWRKLLKVTCNDAVCDKFVADLRLEAPSAPQTESEQPEGELEERTVQASDFDLDGDDDLGPEILGSRIPESFRQHVVTASAHGQRAVGSEDVAMNLGSTSREDARDGEDDDEDDEDDDLGFGLHAHHFASQPDEGEQQPRSENERYMVEPADWHARDDAGFTFYVENSDGVMCRTSPTSRAFLAVRRRLECWFDYEKNRKLFFSSSLRDVGVSNPDLQGERLLAHPPAGDETGLRWKDSGNDVLDAPSRRIWPSRSSPATQPVVPAPAVPAPSTARPFPWVPAEPKLKIGRKILELAASAVSFDSHPLPPLTSAPPDPIRTYVVWELQEMDFRATLYTTDYVIRQAHGQTTDPHVRESQLRQCWGGGDLKPNELFPSPFSSTARTPEKLDALKALFRFMADWPRSEDFLKVPESPWTVDNMDDLAAMVWRCYAQTHFDYLRSFAPLPYIRPPLPWP
ncbi:hypothetical protein AURDEDRAFT_172962 [Auricularia subglabra TFB-10046 SS5]|uniref:Uncharacterized protein n=1 Tax=Auricularia subglabra (strain TFB-10046 / SS5) TaxID=717982 RepID=J0DBI8_AURST|nr:hypothetical protein AURDEDRAFT_172962 [Auricularia subglabra TFB-10046 SS5]